RCMIATSVGKQACTIAARGAARKLPVLALFGEVLRPQGPDDPSDASAARLKHAACELQMPAERKARRRCSPARSCPAQPVDDLREARLAADASARTPRWPPRADRSSRLAELPFSKSRPPFWPRPALGFSLVADVDRSVGSAVPGAVATGFAAGSTLRVGDAAGGGTALAGAASRPPVRVGWGGSPNRPGFGGGAGSTRGGGACAGGGGWRGATQG